MKEIQEQHQSLFGERDARGGNFKAVDLKNLCYTWGAAGEPVLFKMHEHEEK